MVDLNKIDKQNLILIDDIWRLIILQNSNSWKELLQFRFSCKYFYSVLQDLPMIWKLWNKNKVITNEQIMYYINCESSKLLFENAKLIYFLDKKFNIEIIYTIEIVFEDRYSESFAEPKNIDGIENINNEQIINREKNTNTNKNINTNKNKNKKRYKIKNINKNVKIDYIKYSDGKSDITLTSSQGIDQLIKSFSSGTFVARFDDIIIYHKKLENDLTIIYPNNIILSGVYDLTEHFNIAKTNINYFFDVFKYNKNFSFDVGDFTSKQILKVIREYLKLNKINIKLPEIEFRGIYNEKADIDYVINNKIISPDKIAHLLYLKYGV